MKIKIAIADDHPLIIKGLQYILANKSNMQLTGCYTNGSELFRGLASAPVDVLILDIHMPGQSGDELAEILSGMYPDMKMLALTNEDSVYHIKNMFRKGVHGYILKTTKEEILLDAISTVYSGEQYLETALKERVIQDTLSAQKQTSADSLLSSREKEVLRLIGMDLTSQQIADKIFVSKRTVDYYRLCLLTKLGVKNVGALVKKGIQLGYI
ncbi:response regulator transcription factor [Nemorincola caseinilytica]|uniref:Response regulator transcription factor n=1 Tax=Nemorincola caseinilytica TaxID=2054315 RepID=A0ABP8N944_9BACT